jgi:hypothetical protein
MPRGKPIHRLIDELAAAEDKFLAGEFLAPAMPGGQVVVRVAGILCRLAIEPRDFQGFGIFRPQSHSVARLARVATLAERKRYLELFPAVSLVLCSQTDRRWQAVQAHRGDHRFRIDGIVPLDLAEQGALFEVVRARFDGGRFWYDGSDTKRSPATALWLRQRLGEMTDPDALDRPGLTPEERTAYTVALLAKMDELEAAERDRQSSTEQRLRQALAHGGATLVDYAERGDGFRVSYQVGGAQYTSSVSKEDLTVQVAGICLSGEDRKFDLASLVGVLREGADEGVVRVGNANRGMEEEHYWRVHPPRR